MALVSVGMLCGLGIGLLSLYLEGADEVASFELPGGHRLIVLRGREWDVWQNVYIRLKGPIVSHDRQYIEGVRSTPMFLISLHADTNAQVYWLTADSVPDSILYIVDLKSGAFWPRGPNLGDSQEISKIGAQLLSIANKESNIYHLHDGWSSHDRIHVDQQRGEISAPH